MGLNDTLRSAIATVRAADPADIRAISEADAAAERAAKEAAKAAAERQKRLEAAIPARAAALAADYRAVREAAIDLAADGLARRQLSAELGVLPVRSLAMSGYPPMRLADDEVDRAAKRLSGSEPLPWVKGSAPASEVRSRLNARAAEALHPAPQTALSRDEAEAAARQRREEMRQRQVAQRKADARESGALR
ncbi:MAG: hypothetical protein U0838_01600 [Chloroflexota bacterium]